MKELWAGIKSNKYSEPTYEIRFTTNSQKEYKVLRDICRGILDSDQRCLSEVAKELNKLCKK